MKKIIISFAIGVICFLGGWYLKKPTTQVITITQSEELAKIKELEGKIEMYEEVLDSLENLEREIKVIVKEKIVEVKNLSPDSGTSRLKENLVEYGELTQPSDSFPCLTKDSMTIISPENVIDMNIICTKYEGSLEENKILSSELQVTSEIITQKDSIIQLQDTITRKTIESYEGQLESEKKKKKTWIGISGGLAVIIGLILVL